jgi:dolichol-phosphate mannosyltransferase
MGKGAAIRSGISEASGDFIAIQDADLECDPKDLLRVIEPLAVERLMLCLARGFSRPVHMGSLLLAFCWKQIFHLAV